MCVYVRLCAWGVDGGQGACACVYVWVDRGQRAYAVEYVLCVPCFMMFYVIYRFLKRTFSWTVSSESFYNCNNWLGSIISIHLSICVCQCLCMVGGAFERKRRANSSFGERCTGCGQGLQRAENWFRENTLDQTEANKQNCEGPREGRE